jgi:hypothetical protein
MCECYQKKYVAQVYTPDEKKGYLTESENLWMKDRMRNKLN